MPSGTMLAPKGPLIVVVSATTLPSASVTTRWLVPFSFEENSTGLWVLFGSMRARRAASCAGAAGPANG